MEAQHIPLYRKLLRWEYLPAYLMVAGVLFHALYLRPTLGISKWFGGGLGIYCETNKRNLVTWIQIDGEFQMVESHLFDKPGLYSGKFQWIPFYTPELLERYLEEVKQSYHADQARAQIWEYQYSGPISSGRLVLIESMQQ
ncbi:MAG: hypothetical protein ACPGSB_10920 [Opitutales bacterium]